MSGQGAIFEPLNFERLPVETQLERSREFLTRMRSRRTVRHFSTEPVPYELIENAVATAASAPSGANRQPWTFVVVDDPIIKQAIRQAAEDEERISYEQRMGQEWRDALAPLGTDWHKPHLEDAPYLIVVFAQSYGVDADSQKVKHYYVSESVGIAVGMLLCSLHNAGLATLTHTPNPMAFLNVILRRPPNERAYVIIHVGYPAEDATVPAITRKSLSEVLIRV
jgi:nitroreductase